MWPLFIFFFFFFWIKYQFSCSFQIKMLLRLALDYGTFSRDNTSDLKIILIKLTCLIIASERSIFIWTSQRKPIWFVFDKEKKNKLYIPSTLGTIVENVCVCVHFIILVFGSVPFIRKRNSWKSTNRFILNEAAWSTFCSILVISIEVNYGVY